MTSDERKAWLAGLNVGDFVASRMPQSSDAQTIIEQVVSVSKTVIDTVGRVNKRSESRYRRGTGRSTTGLSELYPVTEPVQEASDRWLLESLWYKHQYRQPLPITTVRKLLAVLAEAEDQQQGKEEA